MSNVIKVKGVNKTYYLVLDHIRYIEADAHNTLTVHYIGGVILTIPDFKSDDLK